MLRKFMFVVLVLASTVSIAAPDKADSMYFLTLSDIHFDPFIPCYGASRKPCSIIQSLREAPVSRWHAILEKHDKTVPAFRLDTNFSLFKSTLAAANQAAISDHAKFVVVLGDFIGHDFRKYYRKYAHDPSTLGYQSFVDKTLRFVTSELKNAFPEVSVYPVIGNNDTYSRDYRSVINGDFFNDVASIWSPLFKSADNRAAMRRMMPYAGYYSVYRQQDNLRLVVLNSVLFSYKAKGQGVVTAAKRQLSWLRNELAVAKKKNQKVLIAMHIPVGIDVYATLKMRLFTLVEFWRPSYVKSFNSILSDYPEQVVGVLSGHMHSDWFQIMTFNGGDNEIALSGSPAVSPIFGNNPGFKLYQYSLAHGQISDYYTYYYPIAEKQSWGLEYEFNRIYQPHCHLCSLIDGMKKLQLTGETAGYYIAFYTVGKDSEMQPISTRWNPYYWCFTRSADATQYKKCIAA